MALSLKEFLSCWIIVSAPVVVGGYLAATRLYIGKELQAAHR
jgi:dihydroxyacetone kinase DhaKLM complex PTS-EIIA-like component DhaM